MASDDEEGDMSLDDLTDAEGASMACAPPAQKTCGKPAQVDVSCAPPAQKSSAKPALEMEGEPKVYWSTGSGKKRKVTVQRVAGTSAEATTQSCAGGNSDSDDTTQSPTDGKRRCPEVTTQGSTVGKKGPVGNTQGPTAGKKRPEVTTQAPNAGKIGPEVTTQGRNGGKKRPEVTTQGRNAGNKGPDRATQAPNGGKVNPEATTQGKNKVRNRRNRGKVIPDVIVDLKPNEKVPSMTQSVKNLLGHEDFTSVLKGTGLKFKFFTLEDYYKAKAFFVEGKISFHSFTPRGETPFSVIVDGLSTDYSEQELRGAFGALGLKLDIQRCFPLGRSKWLLHLTRESDIVGLYRVKRVLMANVVIRKDRKERLPQCHNCQRFGHTSSGCYRPFRCVKCSGDHGPGKCTVPAKGTAVPLVPTTDPVTGEVRRAASFTLRCANCGVNGHVASSKDCPKRKAFLAKRVKAQSARVVRDFPLNSGKIVSGVSYAAAAGAPGPAPPRVASNSTPSRGASSSGIVSLVAEFEREFGGAFIEKASAFLELLKAMRNV